MLKLYYANPSRAIRPRWLLEEIGAPYELVRLDLAAGEQKRPEYLAINPNGTVPALVDGDLKLFESAAICQYLADKFPEPNLAPALGTPARGLYYQWMHYAMSSIDGPVIGIIHHTSVRPEAERIAAVAEECRHQLEAAARVLEAALAGKTFILGDVFGAADVMIGSGLIWAAMMKVLPADLPAVSSYAARLAARPAFQRATAD
jgi:glutathione S-transferase